MEVLILPISGGRFPIQLGLIRELMTTDYKSDVTLASSGGNVAAYIALAGDWNNYAIERVAKTVTSNMFLRSWWPSSLNFMPSWIIGVFRTSIYRGGDGVEDFFNENFTSQTIGRHEIWTGTTEVKGVKAAFFCNRSKEDSILDASKFNSHFIGAGSLRYNDNNISQIALSSLASASIPSLVPEVEIDDDKYQDGGVLYASPLTPMLPIFPRASHYTYISCINSEALVRDCTVLPCEGIKFVARRMEEFLSSAIRQDRLSCIRELSYLGKIDYTYGTCDKNKLMEMMELKKQRAGSLLELYPNQSVSINITDFVGSDVVKLMNSSVEEYCYRLWIVRDER